MRTFSSLTQFVTAATPGDRYTEDLASDKRRSVTTYVFAERVSDTKAVLDTITTLHHGRNEYISGQVEHCYETTYRANPTEVRGNSIVTSYGVYDGKTVLAHRQTGVTRYSAKNLRAAHEIGVAAYDAAHPVTETAADEQVADSEYDGDYESLSECIAAGTHLTNVDEDGYCNRCGHDQEDEDDEDSECRNCGAPLRSDTRQDDTGSTRCDDLDPYNTHHVPVGAENEPVQVYTTTDTRDAVLVFEGGNDSGLTPIYNEVGHVRIAYLNADGTTPVTLAADGTEHADTEYGWHPEDTLTRLRTN